MKTTDSTWITVLALFFIISSPVCAEDLRRKETLSHPDASVEVQRRAAAGDAKAQVSLGNAYIFGGFGVPMDRAEGVRWLQKAADQGNSQGQLCIALAYGADYADRVFGLVSMFTPPNFQVNPVEGVKWLSKAADQGDSVAQLYLGTAYEFGHGVPMDKAAAMTWYKKAAAQGDDKALEALDRLAGHSNVATRSKSPANSRETLVSMILEAQTALAASQSAIEQSQLASNYLATHTSVTPEDVRRATRAANTAATLAGEAHAKMQRARENAEQSHPDKVNELRVAETQLKVVREALEATATAAAAKEREILAR